MIYFIKSDSGHVKIGCSDNDVSQRLLALQCATPFKLTVLKTIPGDYEQERLIHKKFKAHRVRGEWFLLTDDILGFMENPYIIIKPPKTIKPSIKIETELQQAIYDLVQRFGTQEAVARELGISRRYVIYLENGERVPSEHLRKLIKVVLK